MKKINARGKGRPSVVLLAGPNGAGKSTSAPYLLKGTLGVGEFVNADVLAHGLSAFDPESVALSAGKLMLRRLKELAAQRQSFAFETTLASRTFAPWIRSLKKEGYQFHLVFLWLPSPEMAIARVAERVRSGGHDVPPATVRRRYATGLHNFFSLYRPLATTWYLYDNSGTLSKRVASGTNNNVRSVFESGLWNRIRHNHES